MLQRENGPIPDQFRLWQQVNADGEQWFCHQITKRRSRIEIDETGGGILADEMGMGKTLSILALLTSTLNQAHEWAVTVNLADIDVTASMLSAATLVIVHSACEYLAELSH
jgi:SWI/SNF-related matrix-associated actin-dependent regulator of chromatin subfamily A3